MKLIGNKKWPLLITLGLVLLEAALMVLFPLFIGYTIEDATNGSYVGALQLGGLGIATLLVGATRRFFDSRLYASLYQQLATTIGDKEDLQVTTKSAHLGLLTEVVEFLENALPELVNGVIGLVGTLLIIAAIDPDLLVGCLFVLCLTATVYSWTSKRTMAFNEGYNRELERQVEVVGGQQPILLRHHLRKLMRWNIRLSDLETINFSIVWLFMMCFLVAAILYTVSKGLAGYGAIFSLVLYLFQFIESTLTMPIFYQQSLRLKAIVARVEAI